MAGRTTQKSLRNYLKKKSCDLLRGFLGAMDFSTYFDGNFPRNSFREISRFFFQKFWETPEEIRKLF